LELIETLAIERGAAVVDVGGGASNLVDHLIERGFSDLSVLDVSRAGLAEGRRRLEAEAPVVWLCEDLLVWRPARRSDLWHDRAVFHFLVSPDERDTYLRTLRSAVGGDGFVVLGTFAADGPPRCSGLPVARYSVADLTELLGPRFELLATRREEHMTPKGAIQPFAWVAGRIQAD
jgi:hypothetical protein